eukprot:gene6387-17794_t
MCTNVVATAEAFAGANGGWTTKRHVAYSTNDLSVDTIPALQWLQKEIQQQLLPAFEKNYGSAKYEFNANGQPGLSEHEGGSPWSFVIPLNASSDFDGFSGKNRHCGVPITRGVRYILAGFCGDDSAYAQQDDIDEEQERIDEEAIEEEDDQDGDAE